MPSERTGNGAEICQLMQEQQRAVWKVNAISATGSRDKERGWKWVFGSSKSLKTI